MARIEAPIRLRGVGVAAGFFLLGLLLRWPLQPIMGDKLIWLTFYPAVMLSALAEVWFPEPAPADPAGD